MICRVDTDAYAYAIFGVSVLAWFSYGIINNAITNIYKTEAEMTKVALHYALDEAHILRNRLLVIQGICEHPIPHVIDGTVDCSENVGCEDENQEDE